MEKNLMELVDSCDTVPKQEDIKDSLLERAESLEKLGFKELAAELWTKIEQKDKLVSIAFYGYKKITTEKIQNYLNMKVDRYNAEHKQPEPEDKEVAATTRRTPEAGRGLSDLYMPIFDSTMSERMDAIMQTSRIQAIQAAWMYGTGISPLMQGRSPSETLSAHTCDYHKTEEGTIGKFCWTETPVESYKSVPPTEVLETFETHKKRNCFDHFTIASVNAVRDPILFGRLNKDESRYFICQWGDDVQLDDLI